MDRFDGKGVGYAIRIKATKRYRKPKCLKADYPRRLGRGEPPQPDLCL